MPHLCGYHPANGRAVVSDHYLLVLTLLLLIINGWAAEKCKGFHIKGEDWEYRFNPVAILIAVYCWYQILTLGWKLYGG